jgi:hypothetical protein
MRTRPIIIAGFIFALILCLYLLSPWFVPVPPPGDVLLERARQENVKADREAKERKEAHARDQTKLKEFFENRRDSTKFCWVHNKSLKVDYVRIAYSLIIPRWEYREAQEKRFPNSNRFALGGCVIKEDSPECTYVLFCPQCREEETQWETDHHIGPAIKVPDKDEFVSIGADEASGHLLKKIEVVYREFNIAGMVRVNVFISKRGEVIHAEPIKGHQLLLSAASDAAKRLKYKPFVRDGKRVQAITELEIPFALARPTASGAKH